MNDIEDFKAARRLLLITILCWVILASAGLHVLQAI